VDVLRWIETLLLPHATRRHVVRAWLAGRPEPPAAAAAWRAVGAAAARRRWCQRILDRCGREGWSVLAAADPRYPPGCHHLDDPPAVLFVAGDVALLGSPAAVGVVGARRGTERGRTWATAMGSDLARAGQAVVSGLAQGVDAAAHRGCLAAGGRPIGVLGTGLDTAYPAVHRRLQKDVGKAGVIVTEYAPGAQVRPYHFLARNRILAALGRALVVVEAGVRSGALSTVDFTLQLGRDVLVVPGPVDCPHAAGCLQLLRDGAILVRHAGDVIETLGLPSLAPSRLEAPGVDATPATGEEIARRLGWSLDRTLVHLSELELEGRVRRMPGGRYVAVPRPAR
jgi:DNA processing protein